MNVVVILEQSEESEEMNVLGVVEEKLIEELIDKMAEQMRLTGVEVVSSRYDDILQIITFQLKQYGKERKYELIAISKILNKI